MSRIDPMINVRDVSLKDIPKEVLAEISAAQVPPRAERTVLSFAAVVGRGRVSLVASFSTIGSIFYNFLQLAHSIARCRD